MEINIWKINDEWYLQSDKHITKSRTIDNDEHLIIILILIGDLNA